MEKVKFRKVEEPLLKWIGGKRKLLDNILPKFPKKIRHYHEKDSKDITIANYTKLIEFIKRNNAYLETKKKLKINLRCNFLFYLKLIYFH